MTRIAALGFVALIGASPVLAQKSQDPSKSEESAGQASTQEAAAEQQKKKDKDGVRFTFANRPSLRIGSFMRIDFDARIETDGRTPTQAIGMDSARFDVASPRVGVSGYLFDKRVDFELSRDPSEG